MVGLMMNSDIQLHNSYSAVQDQIRATKRKLTVKIIEENIASWLQKFDCSIKQECLICENIDQETIEFVKNVDYNPTIMIGQQSWHFYSKNSYGFELSPRHDEFAVRLLIMKDLISNLNLRLLDDNIDGMISSYETEIVSIKQRITSSAERLNDVKILIDILREIKEGQKHG
jgi:hypothetical protein